MIAFLEELFARLLGARQQVPLRIRRDDPQPLDRQLKGRK